VGLKRSGINCWLATTRSSLPVGAADFMAEYCLRGQWVNAARRRGGERCL